MDINGVNVLLVEDIVDTGHTISRIKEYLIEKGSIDVRICSLLDKPSRRETDVVVDFCGFTVPDVFVVGYGLDASENYRNLPYIAQVKQI
jgi:hypoxanthine phosphoribosyltransferase